MAYTNDAAGLFPIGIKSETYYDEPDASDALGLGCIISYNGTIFRHAVVANPGDIVVGVAEERFKGPNGVLYKRIREGRWLFDLNDGADAVAANRFKIVRAVAKTTVSVKSDAAGPICGIVDEFRGGKAIVRFNPAIAQAIALGITLPV